MKEDLTCAFDQQHLIVLVDFVKFDFNDFATACRHKLADVSCFDGQFAMSAIDQYCELHAARPAMIE